MQPYYTVNTPYCPTATACTTYRRNYYYLWQDLRPARSADDELAIKRLALKTGLSFTRARDYCESLERLDTLPKLKHLVETLHHLEFKQLTLIDSVLNKLGATPSSESLARIDTGLADYLTPTQPAQVLPSHENLRRKLNRPVNAELELTQPPHEPPPPHYSAGPVGSNRGEIVAEYDAETTAAMDAAIRKVAKDNNVSPAKALAGLVLGKYGSPRVVLNMFMAQDLPESGGFIDGYGWVDADTADHMAEKSDHQRDMAAAAEKRSSNYQTPEDIKAFLNGRDGCCRYPGCSIPAIRCQKDHCKDFHDGGPTAASNLVNLCQHHHNIKTDGRVTYILDPRTGTVVWLSNDGTWESTSPEGPLSAKNVNWMRTMAQAQHSRRDRAHTKATSPVLENQPLHETFVPQ
ncbi:HNH endonuclease signature motif containing protein [Corynebacterium sp. LK2590]|uniref:HNH endonuclease signature motif containing protein n=1 Tax=unclassified Corynebacterium TaxID=2624378 RepID=UPI0034CF676A